MVDTKRIIQSVSPIEVIERYTGQRATSGRYLCPFHKDTRPSLTIKTNNWKCWACGKGGNVINFTEYYFGIGFLDACKKLNADFNIGLNLEINGNVNTWEQVRIKSEVYNRQQLAAIRKDIDKEIELLTTVHRVLMQHNGPAEILEKYINEIEALEKYKEFWR